MSSSRQGGSPTITDDPFRADYQSTARNQPQELSRAIQQGIPSTLRGMMWQLMSGSKDEEMEMIYACESDEPESRSDVL